MVWRPKPVQPTQVASPSSPPSADTLQDQAVYSEDPVVLLRVSDNPRLICTTPSVILVDHAVVSILPVASLSSPLSADALQDQAVNSEAPVMTPGVSVNPNPNSNPNCTSLLSSAVADQSHLELQCMDPYPDRLPIHSPLDDSKFPLLRQPMSSPVLARPHYVDNLLFSHMDRDEQIA